MKLGIVYHMPCWRADDGTVRELEGSFARYVDSLAPYFDEVSLCVPAPASARAAGEGTAIRSPNVTLAALPPFAGPVQFYPRLPAVLPRLLRWTRTIDLLHCRVPSPAAVFAVAAARLAGRPTFTLVVGDLRALLPSMPYRGIRKALWRVYTEFEEQSIQWMVGRGPAFANGADLARKHARPGRPVVETTTTTIHGSDIVERQDTCTRSTVRALTVSRIDPRKGLRALPEAVRQVTAAGIDLTLDIVGPVVGAPGEGERSAIVAQAQASGIAGRIAFLGAVPLDRLLPMYREYDLFVLPTLPGEGIPRVLLEAMSAGLPVVTTNVSGIPSLVTHEWNGLLVDQPRPEVIAAAIGRLVADPDVRRSLIAHGFETARRHTLEGQAAQMMDVVARAFHVTLRPPVALPAA